MKLKCSQLAIYIHDTKMESQALLQGMHLRMCGEVLPLQGSDTCDHIWTSPKSYVQRRSLQQSLNPPFDHQGSGSSCYSLWNGVVGWDVGEMWGVGVVGWDVGESQE